MHAFLIIGGNKESRTAYITEQLDALHVDLSDRISVEHENPIGIAHIRVMQKQLSLKPHASDTKALCLLTAEALTHQAQQALLKTLEEPPAATVLYLSAPTNEVFLPTILSRVQIVRLAHTEHALSAAETTDCKALWKAVLESNPVKRLALLPDLGRNRAAFINFLDIQLVYLHDKLLTSYASEKKDTEPLQLAKIMQNTVKTRDLIAANCNPQLCLDHLFLQI